MVSQKTSTPELVHMSRPTKDKLGQTTGEVIVPSILANLVRLWTNETPWESYPSYSGEGQAVQDGLVRLE